MSAADAHAAVQGSYMRMRTLADGTVRVEIDLTCTLAEAASVLSEPGTAVAVARLLLEKHMDDDRPARGIYGHHAKALQQSSFFRTPVVWRAIGSDEDFLAWVRHGECSFKADRKRCSGDIVAAHVRRVANGAGTALKPSYSAIPMCDGHHKLQHMDGETALASKEDFDKLRIQCVAQWARERLKRLLGFESWTEVPPLRLLHWAQDHRLCDYLPIEYREASRAD